MSGVCGWFAAIEAPPRDPAGALAGMLAPMLENSIHTRRAIGQAWAIGGAAPSAANLDLAEGADTTVLTLGRIRFLTSDHEPLAVSGGTASAVSNTYARLRERVFEHVAGEFTIIIIDHARGEILAAVDRMGIHSLSWCESRNTLIFGASNDAINAFPELPRAINLQALYHYLYFHMIPAPGSVWLGRQRLLPGEFLRYAGGRTSTSQYWTPRFDESQRIPFAELKEEFVSTLRSAVASAAEGARVGCFLSGGTDSSTISGMLGLATGASASTYSIGFDEPGYDEMSYARIAARHFGTNHHEYYVTPDDVASLIPRIAESYDQPFGNSSAIPTYYCARMAHADGVERMLGGDGGDELFGGNKRYAKQHVFALYDHVPKALRRHLIAPLLGGLAGASGIPLLRKAKSYVAQASVPMPGRLETYNLLQRIGHERIFTEAFLQAVDRNGPIALLDTIYHGADAQSLINRMLALDFRVTLADNDLPKVRGSCMMAGVDVAFPMLDDSVVDFSLGLPPSLKLKGTRLRWFFKQALADFLPPEIITKQKHGFGLPFGPWLTRSKSLKTIVADSLSSLGRRGVVRAEFLNELTTEHLNAHAGYYGSLVWVLMMLELWLQSHGEQAFVM